MKDVKAFLGIGWKFPVMTSKDTLQMESSKYEEDIKESILIILSTAKGERVMRPEFGCGIHDYVFSVINITTIADIKSSIFEALTLWEPRIEVKDVNVNTEQISTGKLVITIEYVVRATNNRFNLVYPFYLTEGV